MTPGTCRVKRVTLVLGFFLMPVLVLSDNVAPVPTAPLIGLPSRPVVGSQSYLPHSIMKQDWVWSDADYDPKFEGSLWSTSTYAWLVLSRTMTNATVNGQGRGGNLDSGPLATLYVAATSNGAGGDVVPVITSCRVARSRGVCFGGNDIVRNEAGTSAKLVGREIDLMFAVNSTDAGGSIGQPYNVFNIASNATASLVGGINGGTWANGHLTSAIRGAHYGVNSGDSTTSHSFINTTNGKFSDGAILLGRGVTQAVVLGGLAFGTSPFLYSDYANNVVWNLGSGGNFTIADAAGASRLKVDQHGKVTLAALNVSTPSPPASSTSPCTKGDQTWDARYLYVCVEQSTWKRAELRSW
jgi:hypothetical protein